MVRVRDLLTIGARHLGGVLSNVILSDTAIPLALSSPPVATVYRHLVTSGIERGDTCVTVNVLWHRGTLGGDVLSSGGSVLQSTTRAAVVHLARV